MAPVGEIGELSMIELERRVKVEVVVAPTSVSLLDCKVAVERCLLDCMAIQSGGGTEPVVEQIQRHSCSCCCCCCCCYCCLS